MLVNRRPAGILGGQAVAGPKSRQEASEYVRRIDQVLQNQAGVDQLEPSDRHLADSHVVPLNEGVVW